MRNLSNFESVKIAPNESQYELDGHTCYTQQH